MLAFFGGERKITLALFFSLLTIGIVFFNQGYTQTAVSGLVLKGSINTEQRPDGIVVANNYAYIISYGSNLLKIYDVSDVSAPVFKGSALTQRGPIAIEVVGNYAYVIASIDRSLQIFNVSDPAKPTFLGSVVVGSTASIPISVRIDGNYAYVTFEIGGNFIRIVDVSNPAKPAITSSPNLAGGVDRVISMDISGSYAYIPGNTKGQLGKMTVFNIENPVNPIIVQVSDISNQNQGIYIEDNYAYVAGYVPLQIFNVSDPLKVDRVGIIASGALGTDFRQVTVSGKYAYLANSSSVLIFNISNPAQLFMTCSRNFNVPSISISGKYLFVVDWSNTLKIFDVSDCSGITPDSTQISSTTPIIQAPAPAVQTPTPTIQPVQTPIAGTTALNPAVVGLVQTGINPSSIAVSGTYAFVTNSTNNTLEIYDCSNPQKPVLVATIATDANPQSVSIAGQYAYVASGGSDTIQVFYIGYPRSPKFVSRTGAGTGIGTGTNYDGSHRNFGVFHGGGACPPRRLYSRRIYLRGRYGYLLNGCNGFFDIYDFHYPSRPQWLGIGYTDSEPSAIFASDKNIYVTNCGSNKLQIFDKSPKLVGSISTASCPVALAVNGNLAYVISESNNLQTFNIADPASPALLSTVPTDANPQDVFAYGPLVYVANRDSGTLQVFNITDPENPILVGSTNVGKNTLAITGACHVLYTLSEDPVNALQTLNIFSAPNQPTILSTTPTNQLPQDLAISGQNAFVANISGTLQSFDISNPLEPAAVGSAQTSQDARSVAISDPYAYVVSWETNTLEVFDISNPDSPQKTGSVGTVPGPWAVAVSNPYAFVLGYNSNQLQIFDVTNPANPISVGSATTAPAPFALFAEDPYVYVTSLGDKENPSILQTFDISNPAQPIVTGSVETNPGPRAIDIEGPYAFITNWDANTLQVFDISNPINPVLRGSANTGAQPRDVAVSGQLVYVANTGSGNIQVFSASDPTQPQLIAIATTGSGPRAVAINGPFAYVANTNSNSLSAFSLSNVQPALETIAAQLPTTIPSQTLLTPEIPTIPEILPIILELAPVSEEILTTPESVSEVFQELPAVPEAEVPVTAIEPNFSLTAPLTPFTGLVPEIAPLVQPVIDLIPPAAITDLKLLNPTATSLDVSCTAPGDDGNLGTAAVYDVRYATFPITEDNWPSATQAAGEPAPHPAGTEEIFTVNELNPGTRYYFAAKTSDEVPNISPLSNVPDAETLNPLTETAQTTAEYAEAIAQAAEPMANEEILESVLENHSLQNLILSSPAERARLAGERTLAVVNIVNETAQAALEATQSAAEILGPTVSAAVLESLNDAVETAENLLEKINEAINQANAAEQNLQTLEFSILNSDLMGPLPGTLLREQFNQEAETALVTARDARLIAEDLLVKTQFTSDVADNLADIQLTSSESQATGYISRATEALVSVAGTALESVNAMAEQFSTMLVKRMTGGGTIGNSNATHGFELHCDPNDPPNNLEINWNRRGLASDKFHLENLTAVTCLDDPNLNPLPRPADFDTLIATGIGRLNNVPDAIIELTFTDNGEPGNTDFAKILIKDVNDNIVLDASGTLRFGNHQAH